jgi:hypothetical protein
MAEVMASRWLKSSLPLAFSPTDDKARHAKFTPVENFHCRKWNTHYTRLQVDAMAS